MGLKELKQELKTQTKDELIKHIGELYKKYKPVKEYFDFYLEPDEDKLLAQYKRKVYAGFYSKSVWPIKLSVSRKAINEFKKLGVSQESIADLLLYFVECGVELTNDYGDIYESFYVSVESAFYKALEIMSKESLLDDFKDRCWTIMDNTGNIGWGFHDAISSMYYEFYEPE